MIDQTARRNRQVEVVDYQPQWAELFEEMRQVLRPALGECCQRIEHVGSTAIPGLCAKPIIDLVIVLPTLAELETATAMLVNLGYKAEGEKGVPGRYSFRQRDSAAPYCAHRLSWPWHHPYVSAADGRELARLIRFRDILRADPALVREYCELKRGLAERYRQDRMAYTDGKTEFVESVLRLEM